MIHELVKFSRPIGVRFVEDGMGRFRPEGHLIDADQYSDTTQVNLGIVLSPVSADVYNVYCPSAMAIIRVHSSYLEVL